MSLATRCGACGTVFRVVQDQLRVSGGWVRCGRCAQVFNAIENLVDLENDRGGEAQAVGAHDDRVIDDLARVTAGAATSVASEDVPSTSPDDTGHADGADLPNDLGGQDESDRLAPLAEPSAPEAAPAASIPLSLTTNAAADAAGPSVHVPPAANSDLRGGGHIVWTQPPRFVRQAERAERWRHPAVRALLSIAGLVLATLLLAQVTLAWHDGIAHRWPWTRPWVEPLCLWQGCRIEAPRQIHRLTVDSSGLTRAGPTGAYRFTAVIRNRDGAIALRPPSLDLTLSDASGQPLIRRVLDPHELGAPAGPIPAGAEWTLSALLRSQAGEVTGYTIELFYP